MSKCFGTKESRAREDAESQRVTNIEDIAVQNKDWEWRRQQASNWDTDFVTPEQYVKVKLQMLYNEMYIIPTEEEIAHLYELKTEGDINRAVASIIDRAWS